MRRKLILLFVMMIAISSTACGNNSTGNNSIIGEWSADVDLSNAYTRMLNEADVGGFALGEYITIRKFPITLHAIFQEDGTYSISIDQASLNNALNSLRGDLKSGLEKAVHGEFDQYSALMGMSMEDYMSYMGLSMDTLLDGMIENTLTSGELTEGLEREGIYYVVEDRLYMSDNMSRAPDSNVWLHYEVNGKKKLTMESGSGGAETYSVQYKVFPLEFKRTKNAPSGAEAPTGTTASSTPSQSNNTNEIESEAAYVGNSATTEESTPNYINENNEQFYDNAEYSSDYEYIDESGGALDWQIVGWPFSAVGDWRCLEERVFLSLESDGNGQFQWGDDQNSIRWAYEDENSIMMDEDNTFFVYEITWNDNKTLTLECVRTGHIFNLEPYESY